MRLGLGLGLGLGLTALSSRVRVNCSHAVAASHAVVGLTALTVGLGLTALMQSAALLGRGRAPDLCLLRVHLATLDGAVLPGGQAGLLRPTALGRTNRIPSSTKGPTTAFHHHPGAGCSERISGGVLKVCSRADLLTYYLLTTDAMCSRRMERLPCYLHLTNSNNLLTR